MPNVLVSRSATLVLAAAVSVAGAAGGTPTAQVVGLEQLAIGLDQPVYLTQPRDGTGRLFVVEKQGRIRVFSNGQLLPTPFLDITSLVESGDYEQGLLSVAFHPNYATNGRFVVYYTAGQGAETRIVVAEYQVSGGNANVADSAERIVLTVPHPSATTHNGGLMKFGPDGYLYIGTGDGGFGVTLSENAQDLGSLLGKILRIDLDGTEPYAIPPDNPFVGMQNARPEIYAYGFRNPWRFSFDRETQKLWVADVGQFDYEEVDVVQRGGNYGWNKMEGRHCYPPGTECDPSGFEPPVFEYAHGGSNGVEALERASITGGYVFRGAGIPSLQGFYLFGDYVFGSGRLYGIHEGDDTAMPIETGGGFEPLSSFGEDEAGNLYVLTAPVNADESGGPGRVLRIVPEAVTSLMPSLSPRKRTLTVTITGAGFVAGTTVSFGPKIKVRSVTFVSPNELRVEIKVKKAERGLRDVTATIPGGPTVTCIGCFTVE